MRPRPEIARTVRYSAQVTVPGILVRYDQQRILISNGCWPYLRITVPYETGGTTRRHKISRTFGIRSIFVRDACLPACLPAGRTVLYCTTCRYGRPHCRTGCVRDSFGIRLGFVRDSFGMPAFLPASLHACRYGSPHCRTGCVRDKFGIRLGFVRDSFGMPAFLPASLQVVRYCTALHVDTGALIVGRGAFGIRLGFVRDSFGMPAFLPASLHSCRQAVGTRTSTVLHTTSIRTSVVPGVGRTVLSVRRCGRDAAIPPTKFVEP